MKRKRHEDNEGPPPDPLWYKDAIVYELHVRAFHDSDGDGIGDFRGLVHKLDYLQDLGVTALWLLPFYPSPLRDDGYDIADYTNINPIYGKLADFKLFLREAHRRGLRVITELVVNHTSDQHPWFQRARRAKPGSKERALYVWSDAPDKYAEARIIFKDFEPSNWTWDPVANAYFWHRFYSHQPDLNFDNPDVHKAIFDVLDFWLSMGIDGLRLDAVPYLYERDGTNCENLPETHAFLRELRRHVDSNFPNRMLLAEANQWPEDAVAYMGQGDECQMAFHFPVMPRLFMASRMEDRFPIIDILQQTPLIPETCQWALFLRNHDELTLEMVTDEDRDYMYRVYAQDPQARINLGIRRRLAPLLGNQREKIQLMNGLLFSLPGTPVIYYGDEIGMGDNIYLGDRNGVRTPMQWNAEPNAGFSRANPQRLYLPPIIDPEYHYYAINVEAQQNNSNSLLWWMKHLIALRKRYRAFGRGSFDFLNPDNSSVLAFLRRFEDERILVVANLSRFIQAAQIDLSAFKGMVPVEMFGRTPFPHIGDLPYFLTLGPHAFYWFSLEAPHVEVRTQAEPELPVLRVTGSWESLFRGKAQATLEGILPGYLTSRHWFAGRNRVVESVRILDAVAIPFDGSTGHLALVRVQYKEEDFETYQLSFAFAPINRQASPEAQARASHAQSAIARVQVHRQSAQDGENEEGILYEPMGEPLFSRALQEAIVRGRRFKGTAGEIQGIKTASAPSVSDPAAVADATLVAGQRSNTTVAFGNCWLLKTFRRLEEGVNPEFEVGRFVAERTTFRNVPAPAGALKYSRGRLEPITLGVCHAFVPNEGTAWHHAVETLGRYFEQAMTLHSPPEELVMPGPSLVEMIASEVPPRAQEWVGSYLESARLLGQRTAELHLALGSVPDDPAFAPEPMTVLYQRSLYQSMRSQARRAFDILRRRLGTLPKETRALAERLLGHEEEILRRGRRVYERKVQGVRIRGHGDYHLTQVLYTGRDFVIIGFEGENHRPNSQRRLKRSPLRDVASMLRSYHYATLSALTGGRFRHEDVPVLQPWAPFWYSWVWVAFLKAYFQVMAGSPLLPPTAEERALLLGFYVFKRAVNELRYDLLYFPERIRIPIEGLLQMVETPVKVR